MSYHPLRDNKYNAICLLLSYDISIFVDTQITTNSTYKWSYHMKDNELAKKLESIRNSFKTGIDELDSLIAKIARSSAPKEISKTIELMKIVGANENGLPKSRFHEEAKKLGYDVRGLAGFFKGANKSITYIPVNGEDRAFLTKQGRAWLDGI